MRFGTLSDYTAVRAALVFDWSSGQVEGQVNRLMVIKRAIYGQAKFDLLRLRVLYPALPLHNNPAEFGARAHVRKQRVSFGPRSPAGIHAWDTFLTLAATTAKFGLSFYAYILDRVSQTHRIPSLADLIDQRAHNLDLATTWSPD